jgi:hypothetical protein
MIRDAEVRLTASTDHHNKGVAVIEINGEHEHRFSPESRVSKALSTTPIAALEARLNGGSYFMVNGELVDFRDGYYNGFVHDDDAIDSLVHTIGFEQGSPGSRSTQTGRNVRLGRTWSENPFEIPLYNEGGRFTSRLSFNWNPFNRTVNSAFQIVRLICTNGMMGLTNFLNSRIPLENRWEEHLDIASAQIQNKIDSILRARLGEMGRDRATVADLLALQDHAENRMGDTRNAHTRERLLKIRRIVSPEMHLGETYKPAVFQDRRLAAQMPGHLTEFDAYNIATELSSHTHEGGGSSDHALDRMANNLVFSRKDHSFHAARFGAPALASFSDADAAFFGDMA